MGAPDLAASLGRALANPAAGLRELDRLDYEASLYAFFKAAWPQMDPAPYVDGWHLEAIAEHLQAVTDGHIRRLLVNVPPRCSKTKLVQVAWPAWIWAQRAKGFLRGPQVSFMCLTYANEFALEVATTARRLVESEWYQSHWGHLVSIAPDQAGKGRFDTTAGGSRMATSFGGQTLGRGADVKIIDDPHKVDEVESELVRKGVITTYDEALASRVTDPKKAAEVIIMQRLHEGDLSGHVLSQDDQDLVHLCLPMRFDETRKCVTGWRAPEGEVEFEDPRTVDGELLWPDRFGSRELARFEAQPYLWAGQYQQSPVPRGGGMFPRAWWKLWPPEGEKDDTPKACMACSGEGIVSARGRDGRMVRSSCHVCSGTGLRPVTVVAFPAMEYIVASVDTAMATEKQNDWSACTVWGVWRDPKGDAKLMLMEAWHARLEFKPLVDRIIGTCRKRRVDRLLIEAKANGISVVQEITRLCRGEEWGVTPSQVKHDKVARAYSVQHLLENGLVFAPDRKWADLLIDEMATFPKGQHDDLVDTAVQAWKHLRTNGMAQLPAEAEDDRRRRLGPGPVNGSAAPYDV